MMKIKHPVADKFLNNRNGYDWLQWTGYCYHPGFDYNYGFGAQDQGEPVYPMADGWVVFVDTVGQNRGFGCHVVIKHEIGGEVLYTHYAHMQNVTAQFGFITADTQIGEVGKTGNVLYSPHLHFEIIMGWWYDEAYAGTEHQYYPDWQSKQFVEERYYSPFEYINNHNELPMDEELQAYKQALKDLGFMDNVDTESFTRGEASKVFVNMYRRLMEEVGNLAQRVAVLEENKN